MSHFRPLIAVTATLVQCVAFATDRPDCATIDDDTQRLACYDEWFADTSGDTGTEALPDAEQPLVDKFGAEQLPPADIERVEARLVGDFDGWTGNTVFRLDNGQVWQQTRNYIPDYKPRRSLPQPKVTIERGIFGVYNLKVDGVKRIVQVKRIR